MYDNNSPKPWRREMKEHYVWSGILYEYRFWKVKDIYY